MKQNSLIAIAMMVIVQVCWTWYSNLFLFTSSIISQRHPPNKNQNTISMVDRQNSGITKISGASFICPSALKLFKNITELRIAIDIQIQFHQRGGNLASIENYLNDQMQSTLDRLGIEFVPKEEDQHDLPSIEYLQQYYKSHEVKRGGCE